MRRVIVETVATSTAHGISRAASTQSTPLRVAWILLFFLFLGFFCNNATTLVHKLMNVSIVTTSKRDKVPFEFPDLYFCPTEPISGSYPYTLSESEAATINDEVESLSKLYDEMIHSSSKWREKAIKVFRKEMAILSSMSPQALKLLIHRTDQSVEPFTLNVHPVTTFLASGYTLCFKANMTREMKQSLQSQSFKFASPFSLQLFTDPYNPHFNYTGHPVRPIVDTARNRTTNVTFWGLEDKVVPAAGYTLIMVPEGAYPTMYDATLSLAPGRSYDITLSMDQIVYSEELRGKSCNPDPPNLQFVDFVSSERVEYSYSHQGCAFDTAMRSIQKLSNFTVSNCPVPWDLRHSPRYFNLTEMLRSSDKFVMEFDEFVQVDKQSETYALNFCQLTQPCVSLKYRAASFSFHKWPKFYGQYSKTFKFAERRSDLPALTQLARIAEQLDSGDHANHKNMETEFRNFLLDSMLQVNIRAESPRSTQLVISYSYSWTAFLADIGGLLGLYIGCSLLTVCELFELLYHLVVICADRRRSRRDNGDRDQELTDAAAEKRADIT